VGADPTEIVRHFLARWAISTDEIYASLRDTLAPDAVWENIGLSRTVGPEEAVAAYRAFGPMAIAHHIDVDLLAIAASGSTVLTERCETVVAADGAVIIVVRTMGSFEIANGKIAAWRDYFDTAPFLPPAG